MSVVGQNILAGAAGAGAYTIDQSLRFEESDSAKLSRVQGAGNRKTWTFSCWFKRGKLATAAAADRPGLMGVPEVGGSILGDGFRFVNDSDILQFMIAGGSYSVSTTQKFRDPAAWYHFVCVSDTTQATASDRMKFYVNGAHVTDMAGSSYPTQNYESDGIGNSGYTMTVGQGLVSTDYWDGELAEVHFIDGTVYDADDFGETNLLTNQWIPKEVTGLTYGTNGFYLKFDGQMDGFTKLLLHCDGANDGTTFTDSSPSAHTMTANGDAHTDTAVKKFGTAAMQLDGTGDSVSTPDSTDWDFGDGDWTIEAWIYPDTLSGEDSIYQQYDSDTNKCQMWRAGSNISFHANASGTHRILCVTPTDSVTISTWQHVAVVAFNKTVKIFIDGVSQTLSITLGANPYSGAMPNVASVL